MSRSLRHAQKGPKPGCFSGIHDFYTETCSSCGFAADCVIMCLGDHPDYDKEKA